LKINHKNRKN